MNYHHSLPLKEESDKAVSYPHTFLIYTQNSYSGNQMNLKGSAYMDWIPINNLRYADDTALIATDHNDLQEIATKVKEESSKAGLDMNVKKTKTMVIFRKSEDIKLGIKVNNETLEQAETF